MKTSDARSLALPTEGPAAEASPRPRTSQLSPPVPGAHLSPDVRQLVRSLHVAKFRYRDFAARPSAPSRLERAGAPAIVALVSVVPGTGRTTLAANLTRAFARRGWRSAAFGLDPKADLDRHFGPALEESGLVRWRSRDVGYVPFGRHPALALDALGAECDAILVDTPLLPGQDALTEADEVLVVCAADGASCLAVPRMEDLLAQSRMRAWRRTPARYVVNRFDARRPADREALATLRRALGPRLLHPPVHEDARLARGGLVFEAAPDSQVAADLAALARALLPKKRAL